MQCSRHVSECGSLSWSGLCSVCGQENFLSTVEQMQARSGPKFDIWRRSMAACVGGVLLDEQRDGT